MPWYSLSQIQPVSFRCGHCGKEVANDRGYWHDNNKLFRAYPCPGCDRLTFFDGPNTQFPGVAEGHDVEHLPEDLAALYREARACCSVSAYTASVLASRKLLMNIAVAQGAKEGLSFLEYVEYLASAGYVPPNGKGWVDHVRKKGNEATHQIALMGKTEAKELLGFLEMLLKFIYEFPKRIGGA